MDKSQKLRDSLKNVHRIVVKVGSAVLVQKTGRPDLSRIDSIIQQLSRLHHAGKEIVLVSSGAIAAGVEALGLGHRPTVLPKLQMAASIGQVRLMTEYARLFKLEGCKVGQVLLTRDDLKNRARHLNARNTMMALLKQRIIPVINENDVVSVDEIKFGDNDLLAALVTILLEADVLILLTSTDGLQKLNRSRESRRVPYLKSVTEEAIAMASGRGNEFSSGGMASKLRSAQTAVDVGINVVIADGRSDDVIAKILDGQDVGTLIGTSSEKKNTTMNRRKRWIAFFHKATGSLIVDNGAEEALLENNVSLLPIGIRSIEGEFSKGALVNIKSMSGQLIAKGLVDYSSDQIARIKGQRTQEIQRILGSKDYEEVIHRENMVIVVEKQGGNS
ncbi:MAG: glutamate 5-kinase [bacterium]